MTRDEAKKILGESATEEQITNLLNNYHVNENAKVKELEEQLNLLKQENEKHSDYDTLKNKVSEMEKANMSEQEKLEEMKKEIETNLKNSRITVNTAKAKEILAGENVSDKIIAKLVSDNEQDTIESATLYKQSLQELKDLVAKETKESLLKVDVTPTISNVSQNDEVMNFEKFSTLSASEQEKWISEHPTEFENL